MLDISPYGRPTALASAFGAGAFFVTGAPRARDHSRSESDIVFRCLRILPRLIHRTPNAMLGPKNIQNAVKFSGWLP